MTPAPFTAAITEPGIESRILVADKTGASVIIGAKDGKLQVEKEHQCRGFGYGGITLNTLLALYPEATVTNGFSILRNCRQAGQFATRYSSIYDLNSRAIYLYPFPERDDEVRLNLALELKKGGHYYDMPLLLEQLPQAPRPLLTNMKRFPMDEYKPIPDTEPEVTAHVRALMQDALNGTPRPEDYTPEMWKQVLPVLQAMQAEAKVLGGLITLTLVERSEADGQRSYRYRLEFQNVAVLEHIVFDAQNKCSAGGPEALAWKPKGIAATVPSDSFAGIGVVLGVEGQSIVVKDIVPGSPAAAQKDLRVGDRIIAVAQDKEPAVQVQSLLPAQAVALIRGPKGTTVHLTVVPAGEDESHHRVVSLVRGEPKTVAP